MLKIDSDESFEYAVMLSLLSRKPVEFLNYQNIDINIEILECFKLVSPEMKYKINDSSIELEPGFLKGGKLKGGECRIPLCLKNLIMISPFLPENIELELTGVTNYEEFSVDIFKVTFFKIFRLFDIPAMELNIKKRGFAPDGEGVATFKGNSIRTIDSIDKQETDPLSKIRGFVITSRIGSDFAHRMIDKVKSELSDLAHTKVLCIVNNREDSGPSPGYECSVLGESNDGVFFETMNNKDLPEKMAEMCCKKLMKGILKGGLFDQKLLPILIIYMGLAKGISRLQIGKLDKLSKKVLNLLNTFFGVGYKLTNSETGNILMVGGCRYSNIFKPL